MAKKRTPRKKEPTSEAPRSELASLVMGCKDDPESLPILADFLDEKLNLPATAEVLRAPDLRKLPRQVDPAGEFHYCRLERDVFLWLLRASYHPPRKWDPRPGIVVGLYAHPEGLRERWAKIGGLLPLKETGEPDPEHPWRKVPEPEPRFDRALEELMAFASRPRYSPGKEDPRGTGSTGRVFWV